MYLDLDHATEPYQRQLSIDQDTLVAPLEMFVGRIHIERMGSR